MTARPRISNSMNRRRGNILRLMATLVFLFASAWIYLNTQLIQDQLSVWNYQPDSSIASITERSSLSDRGKFLFYVGQPALQDKEQFNSSCDQHTEKSIVLGCYDGRYIYIYNIDDQRLDGINEVTAAHEMLHIAYERLSDQERERINALLEEFLPQLESARIAKRITLYEQTEPGQRYNELHSMIGTEVRELPTELSRYYDQYFHDRLALVGLAEKYEAVFTELEDRQQALVNQIDQLVDETLSQSDAYKQLFDQLQTDIQLFNQRARSGVFTNQITFDAERAALVRRQGDLERMRAVINQQISHYHELVAELDSLNLMASQLRRSIDSRALPEVPTI